MTQVVVTGIGAVTPLGVGARTLHERWLAGQSGIEDGEGKASEYEPKEHLSIKEARRADRFTQFAMVAGDEALAEAGWSDELPYDPTRIACIIGTGIGGIGTLEHNHDVLRDSGPKKVSPLVGAAHDEQRRAGRAVDALRPARPRYGIVSACAAGAHAIGNVREPDPVGHGRRRRHRRLRGGADAAVQGRLRRAGRAVRARHLAPVRRPPRRLRDGRGRRGARARGRREGEGARRDDPRRRSGATAPRRTPTTSPPRSPRAAARRRRSRRRSRPPASSRRTSTTSTPTAPRRRSTTAPRRRRSSWRSATTRARSRSPRPSRRSGTCSARPARSRPSPPSSPCATGWPRPRWAGRSRRRAWTSTTCPNEAQPLKVNGRPAIALSNAFGFGGHNAVLCLEAA